MTASETHLQALKEKITNRTAIVGVVGLGYVGLPFAVEKAKVGFRVIGVEQNPRRAELVNRGQRGPQGGGGQGPPPGGNGL